MNLDIENLLTALDNEKNDSIMNLTTPKIQETIFNILKELHLDKDILIAYFKKLKGYKYVDEIQDLKYGGFIRWIPLTDPSNLPLNQCGIICDIKILDDGVYIVCKNFMHRHYRFKMDECLIFQKLSAQELVILSALDHLDEEDNKLKPQTNLRANTMANSKINLKPKPKPKIEEELDLESEEETEESEEETEED
jgi:hypothetical protein